MAHIVVRIIELLVCIGLAAATTAIFVVAVITVVHGLRMRAGVAPLSRAISTKSRTPRPGRRRLTRDTAVLPAGQHVGPAWSPGVMKTHVRPVARAAAQRRSSR
jgi:hypothetical protein